MSAARFFTDEDVYAAVALALRRAGIDAVSTAEVRRLGQSDESQLLWASAEGRAVVTFNVAHFAALHRAWLKADRHHAGIVLSSQRPIGDVVRRLSRLAAALDRESLCDRLEFLGDW
jgi:hypothetical protein